MAFDDDVLAAFETHDTAALHTFIAAGFDPSRPLRDKLPLDWLLEMYFRSSRFPDCVRLLIGHGARIADPALQAVLLDDPEAVRDALRLDPPSVHRHYDLISAFTPLRGASLLHVAAEYGHLAAARALIEAGAMVEARAASNHPGESGQTPLFHTVNSPCNHGEPVMCLLLAAGARTDVHLTTLSWGRSFEWETTLFDVTPLSYCQAGLLPQMHRQEADIYRNLETLCAAAGRAWLGMVNVPNRYLLPRKR